MRPLFFSLLLLSAMPFARAEQSEPLNTQLWDNVQESKQEYRGLNELQKFQFLYDEDYWFNRDFPKFRHIFLHLVDDVGKLSSYCEAKEHGKEPDTTQLVSEVLPDLLMHILQYANAFGIDLEQKYQERIASNIKRMEAARSQEQK